MLKEPLNQEELDDLPMYKMMRVYKCESCNEYSYDVCERRSTIRKKKCPHCGKNKLDSVVEAPRGYVYNNNTVAQLADRNTKRMGHYELQEKRAENQKRVTNENLKKAGYDVVEQEITPESIKKAEKHKKLSQLTDQQKIDYVQGKIDV